MGQQPLEGIKVLDLSNHIVGSYCCKQWADYGASVIKIEKPGRGCLTRSMYPFAGDDANIEKSLYHLYLNTNKKSLTLNLKSAAGQKILRQLVKDTDILIESFAPATREALGLNFEELEQINPKLVMMSISNFGQTGPYRDYKASDLIMFAMGGSMSSQGRPDRHPINKGRDITLFETGIQCWYQTMAVYMGTRKDGIGDYIDCSIMDTEEAGCERRTAHLLGYSYTGDNTLRRDPHPKVGILPRVVKCKDGYLNMGAGPGKFGAVLTMLGHPDKAADPSWNVFAFDKDEECKKIFAEGFAQKTKQEWAALLQDNGIIAVPVNTPADVCNDLHWEDRQFWQVQKHEVAGDIKMPRGNIHVEPDWWALKSNAPLLGQHNNEVLESLGYSKAEIVTLKTQGII